MPAWNRFPRGPNTSPIGPIIGRAMESGERGAGPRRAANVAGPATPSGVIPAQRWNLRSAASVCEPKWPSKLPDGKPCQASANCSAATSHPRMPTRSGRPPSGARFPYRPSALRVRGPGTPSAERPARCWNRRTARSVPGPRTPSTVPLYTPRFAEADLESGDLRDFLLQTRPPANASASRPSIGRVATQTPHQSSGSAAI